MKNCHFKIYFEKRAIFVALFISQLKVKLMKDLLINKQNTMKETEMFDRILFKKKQKILYFYF